MTQRFGINISAKKSEILYIGRGEGDVRIEDVQLRGQRMKQAEEFVYLGSVFTSDGRYRQDIERRRAGATRSFGTLKRRLWGRRDVSRKVKMKIFNAVANSHTSAFVWSNGVGADNNRGEKIRRVRDEDVEEYHGSEME